jgi:hypothetical protein
VQMQVELKRGSDNTKVPAYLVEFKLQHAEEFESFGLLINV